MASGHGLGGGSGRSAHDVWSFGGTGVAHWNGSAWSRTSVARLLPAALKSHLNDSAVTGVFEQSADSVYATGNGNDEDDGGPMVLLHWNGRRPERAHAALLGRPPDYRRHPRRAEPDQHRRRGPHSRHFRGPGGRLHARGGNAGLDDAGVLLEYES